MGGLYTWIAHSTVEISSEIHMDIALPYVIFSIDDPLTVWSFIVVLSFSSPRLFVIHSSLHWLWLLNYFYPSPWMHYRPKWLQGYILQLHEANVDTALDHLRHSKPLLLLHNLHTPPPTPTPPPPPHHHHHPPTPTTTTPPPTPHPPPHPTTTHHHPPPTTTTPPPHPHPTPPPTPPHPPTTTTPPTCPSPRVFQWLRPEFSK